MLHRFEIHSAALELSGTGVLGSRLFTRLLVGNNDFIEELTYNNNSLAIAPLSAPQLSSMNCT